MNQLHIVQSIASNFGGLGLAALRYSQSLGLAGEDVDLYIIDRSGDELVAEVEHGPISLNGGFGHGILSRAWALKRYLDARSFDIVHIHGTWTPLLAIASYFAFAKGIPVIISPHGCLEPWALHHRKWKKVLALRLYQRKIYRKASMMVATAEQELASIRQLGLSVPVAVIPLGVDIPKKLPSRNSNPQKLLFLSRIHPKKGLHDLVAAWKKVRRPGWSITIAGPDEDGHLEEVRAQIISLGLERDFEFTGLVVGDYKETLFSGSDIFILPTHSENFGIAIAESLAHGIPVITTTGAPWKDLVTWDCGWWVQPGTDGIASALIIAMDTPRDQLLQMGNRGIKLVKEKYSWPQIGNSALQAYQWVLGDCSAVPDFVDIPK